MKFLTFVKLKAVQPQDPKMLIAINEASRAWIKANLENGKLDFVYNVMPNAAGYYGVGISNAGSIEEAYSFLAGYPGFLVNDFKMYPLSDVNRAIDDVVSSIKKMGG